MAPKGRRQQTKTKHKLVTNFADDLGKKAQKMGGFGSGNKQQSGRLTVGQCVQLNVSKIKKHGLLQRPAQYEWKWSTGSTLSLDTRTDGWITLEYAVEKEPRKYRIRLEAIPQHLGGERHWFRCPNTRCGRRCKTVYLRRGYFLCRQCQRLGYVTEQASKTEQPHYRINKIRERLGWTPGYLNGHESKPKGMHWATYRRLVQQHDNCAQMLNVTILRLIERANIRLNTINQDADDLINYPQ